MQIPKLPLLMFLGFLGLLLISCGRDRNTTPSDKAAARQAGREAYRASQDVKHGAKEAAKELRSAGKEFRAGWSEEKHREAARPEKHPSSDRDHQR